MAAMLRSLGMASPASVTISDLSNKVSVYSLPVTRFDVRSVMGGIHGTHCKTGKIIAKAVAAQAENPTWTASKTGHELSLFEALREGLEEEMECHPRVCVMGEDVGHYGGSYKVTKDLTKKFGDLRVLDTPIAENSFTGMVVGAA